MNDKDAQFTLRNYFLLVALEGLISLAFIFSLPKDPDSNWIFGYSPFRLFLITIAFTTVILFFLLSYKSSRNVKWASNWFQKVTAFLQDEKICTSVIGFLLVFFLLGVWLLISVYPLSTYRTPAHQLGTIETIYAYALRLTPFVFWSTAVSLQTNIFVHLYGFGSKEKYYRVFSVIAFFIVPFLLVFFFIVNTIDQNYYKFITNEDNFVEWLTIVCLVLAGIFSLLIAAQIKNRSDPRFWFFMIFAFVCVLSVLEEISWGQRIFDIQSPQFFLENSDQQEINIHNVIQEWFSFQTKNVAAWISFVYGVIFPLITLKSKCPRFFRSSRCANSVLDFSAKLFVICNINE